MTCQSFYKCIGVVEQPGIPDPGFEKFRIFFHDRIRAGARQFCNFGSTNLNRYTLKMKFFIALHVTNLPLIQHPMKSCTYTTIVIPKRNCKDVDINVRHSVSLTGNDRHRMRFLKGILTNLLALHEEFVANDDHMSARTVLRYARIIFAGYNSISTVEIDHPINYEGDGLRFNVLAIGMIAPTYRFKSVSQLRELKDDLRIPDRMVNPLDRSVYDGEELLLLVLECCALGTRLIDLQNKYHRNHSAIGKAINFSVLCCSNVGAT